MGDERMHSDIDELEPRFPAPPLVPSDAPTRPTIPDGLDPDDPLTKIVTETNQLVRTMHAAVQRALSMVLVIYEDVKRNRDILDDNRKEIEALTRRVGALERQSMR